MNRPLVLGIGGTLRALSSTEKALALSLRFAASEGAETILIPGADLKLPLYAPEYSDRSAEGSRLVALFKKCDAIIIATPSYHGSVSGLVKNALDYAEDLRQDERPYFEGRAVGLIVGSAGWQGGGQTLAALRAITHSLRGWPTPMGAILNTSLPIFDDQGNCTDTAASFQLETLARQVVQFARMLHSRESR